MSEIEPDIAHVTHLINHTSAILEVLNEFKVPTVATLTDFFGFCFNNKLEKYDGSLCVGPQFPVDELSGVFLSCCESGQAAENHGDGNKKQKADPSGGGILFPVVPCSRFSKRENGGPCFRHGCQDAHSAIPLRRLQEKW